jgi:hypothetical protein
MLQLAAGDGVFENLQANVTLVGVAAVTVFGVAVNAAINGAVAALTNTVR